MSMPLVIASRAVADPLEVVSRYIERHYETIDVYDGAVNEDGPLTLKTIAATRKISSRISNTQAAELVRIVNNQEWNRVPVGARLEHADPRATGGLFDAADEIYSAVLAEAPEGVKSGKVHKVLYLKRPNLFPIVDSRLRRLYFESAMAAAVRVKEVREEFPYAVTFWGAIREDLIVGADALAEVRSGLISGDERARRVSETVSSLRLLDMVAWKTSCLCALEQEDASSGSR